MISKKNYCEIEILNNNKINDNDYVVQYSKLKSILTKEVFKTQNSS